MYDGLRRHVARRAGGDCAPDVSVDAHRGNHWDFLCRHEQAAQEAARGTCRQRREFARCLLARAAHVNNLMCAIEYIARETKAAGANGHRPEQWSRHKRWEVAKLLGSILLDGTYRRGPVRRQPIPKASGNGTRILEIPDAEDKIVQRALVQVLQPLLDPGFDERSFGFRPGLGREHALACAGAMAWQADTWTWITEDIRDAFTQIPHRRLFDVLRYLGLDEAMLSLIVEVIGNDRGRGLPQGGSLSPFLLNVYCDHFLDVPWRQRYPDVVLVRVADDLLLQAHDRRHAESVYSDLERLLRPAGLPLKGNRRDAIRQLDCGQHADWLGCRLRQGQRGIETRVGPKSWSRLADKLARAHAEPAAALRALEMIQGWADQLGACYDHEDRQALYARMTALAREHAFEEIPSDQEFDKVWQQANERFYHLRRVVILRMHGRMDLSEACCRPDAVPATPGPRFTLYTDGSCRGNPGIGGWAFILEGPTVGERVCRADSHPATTNNRMELVAVVRGLEALCEPARVHIVTDSRYVHEAITRWMPRWQQNGWRSAGSGRLAHIALWQRLHALMQPHDVTCEWVRGHCGHAGNEEADRLAGDAACAHASTNL